MSSFHIGCKCDFSQVT